jgi:hypothetical protein
LKKLAPKWQSSNELFLRTECWTIFVLPKERGIVSLGFLLAPHAIGGGAGRPSVWFPGNAVFLRIDRLETGLSRMFRLKAVFQLVEPPAVSHCSVQAA